MNSTWIHILSTSWIMEHLLVSALRQADPKESKPLIVQNGNAYEEGLQEFWDPLRAYWADRNEETTEPLRGFLTVEATEWQYTDGTRQPERISPDNWNVDMRHLSRPGNEEIQLELFHNYGTNPTTLSRMAGIPSRVSATYHPSLGKKMIISFPIQVPILTFAMFQMQNCTSSTQDTSSSKKTWIWRLT